MKKYRAVLFDLGWTLVDLPKAADVKLLIEETVGAEAFVRVREIFHAWHAASWTTDEFIARVGDVVLMTDTLRSLLSAWGTNAELVPYPQTIDVLKTLKERGFKIGIISNAPPLNPESLRRLYFTDYIDAWTFSHELGIEKPDPRIFAAALTKLSVTADEALMVGDSLEKDILGARAAGIDAIQLVRPGTVSDEPDQIASLDELLGRF